MAENGDGSGGSLPEEQRCKRTDGRDWRCRRPVMEGKNLCETHVLQSRHRHRHEPVPAHLKLERSTRKVKIEIEDEWFLNSPPKRVQRKRKEVVSIDVSEEKPRKILEINSNGDEGCSNLPQTRSKRKIKMDEGDLPVELIKKSKGKEKADVKDLKFGTLEIPKPFSSSGVKVKNAGSLKVKSGAQASTSKIRRPIRSKNVEPIPMATVKDIPSVKEKVKASAKNNKKCHWCRWSSYRKFVKCSKCKKNYFCDECIEKKYRDKAAIKSECPVCNRTCECRGCIRERSKEVKAKEPVVYNEKKKVEKKKVEEKKVEEKKFEEKVDKSQQLYMINLLLPLLKQMNQEKMMELDKEAKIKGKTHSELQINLVIDSQKLQCCFCKTCIVDAYRCCTECSYILCMLCCQEFCEGFLHERLKDLRNARPVRSKSSCNISWKPGEDGRIGCPPTNVGGCGVGFLDLQCLNAFSWTKDLEASAKEIVSGYNFKSPLEIDSSFCVLCEGNDEIEGENGGEVSLKNKGFYFSIKKEFRDQNLAHFKHHWGRGQPLIIPDVLKSTQEMCWDPAFLFCAYLERSGRSQKDAEVIKSKACPDWSEIEIGRKQIFVGAKTHKNVWNEILKFKVWFSSGFFQEKFPKHYAALMDALPIQEYMNPLTGLLNLAVKLPNEAQEPNLGPFVYISYGGPDQILTAEFSMKLCYHAYDMVNILVHATERTISEKKLAKVKELIDKYSSRVQNESFNNELSQGSGFDGNMNGEVTEVPDGEVCVLSDDSSIGGDSDDEDFEIGSSSLYVEKEVYDTRGARWDIFCREDVPKLVEFLRKYSDELNQSYRSPSKVVHPILDESFYLDAFHMRKLKEEFDVEPWTIHQNIGEAVIVPAGCPYQVKKIKSCVNVVLEFISPESALESVKLSNEIRQLPVNHKAKGKMLKVKKMAIYGINAAIEEIRNVSQDEVGGKNGE